MFSLLTSFFFDLLIGDPRSNFHPVVLMGNFIAFIEKILYRQSDSNYLKLFKGFILVAIVISTHFFIGILIIKLIDLIDLLAVKIFLEALILSFMISPRSLSQAAEEIYQLLINKNIKQARVKVGWIVGRDTDKLSQPEIVRATIETVSENTVDGIISPLFFFVIGGLPLAIVYRVANTMDSMLGYKNDKYLYFGRCAARLDDILNFIPARITAILFIISSLILNFNFKNAFKIMIRDANKHPSPNGGYAESTVAGALNIRLGGFNSYFGKTSFREYMGDSIEELSPKHILLTIKLMFTATILFLVLAFILFHEVILCLNVFF